MTEHDPHIDDDRAVEIARAHLGELGLTAELEGRTVTVERSKEGTVVAFQPPAGVRAGPFTVTVSSQGEVVSQRFER